MGKYIVVYSTKNNREWQSPCWMTVVEKETLEEAKSAFDNFVSISENKETSYKARDNNDPITQVAIFKICGRDTLTRKPRYYFDNRDKRDWEIDNRVVNGLINRLNSDFTMNK